MLQLGCVLFLLYIPIYFPGRLCLVLYTYTIYSIVGFVATEYAEITYQNIQSSPLQCSRQGDICQFPVKVAGVLHWNCLDRRGVRVCNTRDPQGVDNIQSFDNLDSFLLCEKCRFECINSGTGYNSFKLKNKNNKNIYKDVTSKKDCQQICQVAKGCNFFNFDLSAKTCHLKYGVGKKNEWLSKDTQSIWFGPAYCPGSHAC